MRESLSAGAKVVTPGIYLLSAGADPTESLEQYARKKKTSLACVSMGEGGASGDSSLLPPPPHRAYNLKKVRPFAYNL